ncbi:MAG: hypothetical protein AUG51_08920 [Acidobacteria bacterium 13_1_20CM_3_53_8]|nr:MAG: hypothetical protein AUG51_08920 [Acidobacteria bacterium 13_1_20CM_3_53_8]
MAQEQPTILEAKLFSGRVEETTLAQIVKEYFEIYGEGFALLYSPKAAYLAKLKSEHHFVASVGKEPAPVTLGEKDWRDVFEARIFNVTAELRWLNRKNGAGPAALLCKNDVREFFGAKPERVMTKTKGVEKTLVGALEQTYLLWGQAADVSQSGWTKFAEARIGAFFVPVDGVTAQDL